MKIIDSNPSRPMTTLAIVHNGEEVLFDTVRLKKPATMEVERVFEFINSYLARLPIRRQEAIFNVYKRIKEIMDKVYMDSKRQTLLIAQVKELYVQIQLDEVVYHTANHLRVVVPNSIMDRYEDLEISQRKAGDDTYRKRTYLRKEYVELVDTAIALKAMIPIWGEYLSKITGESLGGTYKEIRCLELLKNTTILRSEVVRRLREYIEITVPGNKEVMSSILHGMGTTDLPDWLLAIAMVRKICVVELSSGDDSANLVSVVYSSVMNTIRSMDRKLSGSTKRLRSLDKPKSGNAFDESRDVMSIYKIKERISIGDLIDGDMYAVEYLDIARRLLGHAPDPVIVEKCVQAIGVLKEHNFTPSEDQEKIVRWLISPVISPWTIDNVTYVSLLHLIAASQIVLLHLNLPDVAVLLTAEIMLDDNGVVIGGIESRSRISKEYAAKFSDTHPYYHVKGGRTTDVVNVAHKGVDDLTKAFSRCDWKLLAPIGFNEHVTCTGAGRYIVSTNLKDQLCVMLDFITTKTVEVLVKERTEGII